MTTYLIWLLPPVIIAVAIASGRLNTTFAALLGLIVAIPVASLTGPTPFAGSNLLHALARGLWIGSTIAPYIIGGLLFWQVAIREASPGTLRALPVGSLQGHLFGVSLAPSGHGRTSRRSNRPPCRPFTSTWRPSARSRKA